MAYFRNGEAHSATERRRSLQAAPPLTSRGAVSLPLPYLLGLALSISTLSSLLPVLFALPCCIIYPMNLREMRNKC